MSDIKDLENVEPSEEDNSSKKPELKMPMISLVLDFMPVLLIWLCSVLSWSSVLLIFLVLLTIFSPVAAIGTGIYSLCLGRKRIGRSGMAISIAAIAIPIIFVVVMVILFSTGVAYIRWM